MAHTLLDLSPQQPAAVAPAGRLSHLRRLEAESIHILREVVAEFERPVMLYSIGKDSSVMLRLAQKAFFPGPVPFPLLHIDTGFKFAEMLTFRDEMARSVGAELLVWRNEAAIAAGTNPIALDTRRCCGLLKIYSFRDRAGQWDPKNQRPELWNLYNARLHPGESIRVFPLSNWTEMDVWQYIHEENIPIVDLYFARDRPMYLRGEALLPIEQSFVARAGEQPTMVRSRLRSLGCSPCTGAIRSDADTLPKIIAELLSFRTSERANRAIDHDQEGSMKLKKREGYF